jgi:ATP-dependent RNA helicase RhlE
VEPEVYIHRIGRTARAGAGGDAVSFCSAGEREFLRAIEKMIRSGVPVDTAHQFHSESARQATGAAARPAPKVLRGGNTGGHASRSVSRAQRDGNPSGNGGRRNSQANVDSPRRPAAPQQPSYFKQGRRAYR